MVVEHTVRQKGHKSMKPRIKLDISFGFVQQIRLAHALTESNFPIVISKTDSPKFSLLEEKFGMQFIEGEVGDIHLSKQLGIVHHKPSVNVGNLRRPLIFPHVIVEYCRTLWKCEREHKYSFAGLVTQKRKELIQDWVTKNLHGHAPRLPTRNRVKQKLYSLLGWDDIQKQQIGDLVFWSSTRGRRFPIKAWDDDYFKFLANSQFVLCPSGDYVWSYRFFEAILCGAIPIVEQSCHAYKGFRFLHLHDSPQDIEWSQEDAEHNFKLCVERITLPIDVLNKEIKKLWLEVPEKSWVS